MATVLKRRRLANPGRKRSSGRRKMSAKQIKYFGTKRQKAALKARRRNAGGSKKVRRRTTTTRRQANIGEIVSIGLNPERKSMARRKRRTTRRRRQRNPVRTVTKYRYRTRPRRRNRSYKMSNPPRRRGRYSRRSRRRNPNMFSGTAMSVLGVLGGAAVTKFVVERLPSNLSVGLPGYIATGAVAVAQGMVATRFGKSKNLGDSMTLGGFTYLALRVMQDFVPGLASISPLGLRGMGVIAPSSFYNPQVPRGNSMTRFHVPNAVPAPVVNSGMQGLGRRVPRMGRMS